MNTCGTCKHFDAKPVHDLMRWSDKTGEPSDSRYHLCGLIKHFPCLSDGGPQPPEIDLAVVIDGDDERYPSALCVSREFGCVMWEQTEKAMGAAHYVRESKRKDDEQRSINAKKERVKGMAVGVILSAVLVGLFYFVTR